MVKLEAEHRASFSGLLNVTCWCERKIVKVTPRSVWRGVTGSCGRPGCHR